MLEMTGARECDVLILLAAAALWKIFGRSTMSAWRALSWLRASR